MTFSGTPILAALLLALGLAPAATQEPECHSNTRFFVAGAANPDYAGNRFAVTKLEPGAAKPACRFDPEKADFVVGEPDEPLWFAGLEDRYLALTASTGPQGSLIVVDLDAQERILDVPADEFALDPQGVTYWERKEEGTAANCPQLAEYAANGLGAVIAHQTRFDFASRTPEATGQARCDATQ